jgi:hypothetical protein
MKIQPNTMKLFANTIIVAIALVQGSSCLKLFNSTAQLPSNMTDSCKEALTNDIACSPRLISAAEVTIRLEHNTTVLEAYCNDTCTKSLEASTPPSLSCIRLFVDCISGLAVRCLFLLRRRYIRLRLRGYSRLQSAISTIAVCHGRLVDLGP